MSAAVCSQCGRWARSGGAFCAVCGGRVARIDAGVPPIAASARRPALERVDDRSRSYRPLFAALGAFIVIATGVLVIVGVLLAFVRVNARPGRMFHSPGFQPRLPYYAPPPIQSPSPPRRPRPLAHPAPDRPVCD